MLKNCMNGLLLAAAFGVSQSQASEPAAPIRGGVCYGTHQALNCEYIGTVTIRQIYEKGWRVVSLVKEGPNTISVVIEEQR